MVARFQRAKRGQLRYRPSYYHLHPIVDYRETATTMTKRERRVEKKKRRRKWKYTKYSHAEAEGGMEGQIERGGDYFQFWQWNFCQNCWLLVSRPREPWQCLVSSLVLARSCWIGICVVKLSISLCFFIIVFIVSTSQLFLFFFSFSLVLSFIRFVIPFAVLIVRCIIEFLIGIFHCSHYLGRVRHFHFSYLRPALGLDFFYSSSITFIFT